MEDIRPRRSALYIPGSNTRAQEKAKGLPVDTIIFDLEDSVFDEVKPKAREQVVETIRAGGYGHREIVMRVNAARTEFFEDDMTAAVKAKPNAVLLSKVESTAEIFAAERHLRGRPETQGIALWAMVETARGLQDIAEIAASVRTPEGHRLKGLLLGTNDIIRETAVKGGGDRTPVLPWLSMAVLAARTEKLFILDGVYNDFADVKGFEAECAQGRALGMDGKTIIHPSQIEAANRLYAPSKAEVDEAREIIAAFAKPENAQKGVIAIQGRMVERLHAKIATRTLKLHETIVARS
ncbi:citrate lyase subunit beta [Terrihabitans soli]|uniref:Citrate lyase subunit beta n=1 Tax=Terrihabitans soli TaxID=708113 RepID=A0A6S6QRE2_9HYPH|nr:CoA ester lyase [Terrihabitans soli]BCJ89450.1 citrate lyase subunit beta [Terrihabitans soli]